jgi:uncharacterized membrane protein YidH (DUF202 family)
LTTVGPTDRSPPESQAERTRLAWTRTSLVVLANGALLLLADAHRDASALRFVAVAFAALLALSTYLIAARRQRMLAKHPLPKHISPRREVYLVGAATIVLIVMSAVSVTV